MVTESYRVMQIQLVYTCKAQRAACGTLEAIRNIIIPTFLEVNVVGQCISYAESSNSIIISESETV